MVRFKLEEILKQKGKTVYWLAKNTGITPPALYKIRDNKTDSVKFSLLESVCTALDCNIGDLLEIVKDK